MAERFNVVAGLDVGTTKVACVIAKVDGSPGAEILGTGIAPSSGSKRGMVTNIEETVRAVAAAVGEAEQMAGVELQAVNVGVAGGHIKSVNSKGIIAIARPDREISAKDIDRCVEQARTLSLPPDRQIIHVLPKEFIVDDQRGVRDPRGMVATRLEVEVHVITGVVSSTQNLIKSVERAGFKVNVPVFQALASGRAVLTADEMELGVALVDMGGGTTDVVVFHDGAVRHSVSLPFGGENVTRDLAVGLRTPLRAAEQIKRRYGAAMAVAERDEPMIEVADVGGRRARMISRSFVAEIIQPRLEEIFTLVKRELFQSGYQELLAAGLVLTGGCAKLTGICDLAEQIFNMPARVGVPAGVTGLADAVADPVFATAVGLVLYESGVPRGEVRSLNSGVTAGFLPRTVAAIRAWFERLF